MGTRRVRKSNSSDGAGPGGRAGIDPGEYGSLPTGSGSFFLSGTERERTQKRVKKLLQAEGAVLVPTPFDSTLAYAFQMVGGIQAAIAAAMLIVPRVDPRPAKIVYAWEGLSDRDRGTVRLEDLCAGAEITPEDFLALVIPALYKRNIDIGQLIAAVSHPKIVEASTKAAQQIQGVEDRKMLLQATGFLPTPKGPSIMIDNSTKTLNASVDSGGTGMPSFEQSSKDLAAALAKPLEQQFLLASAKPSQTVNVPIDSEIIDV